MCLFPKRNVDFTSAAYKHGLTEFDCGSCPECLAKRARFWALRAVMEARKSPSMMITLTYDQEILDEAGNVIGERLPDLLKVDKRDCQLFIKRLRKHFGNQKIKYILTAEYGKTTHRPHYHALIFGVLFDDLIFKKRSKRGNMIFSSPTLTKIWSNGICTVDSVNATAATARYCTKYAAKDGRSADTFMLFSRGIGDEELFRCFNGKSYIIDGQEYPIPRQIWQKIICDRYDLPYPRYRSLDWCMSKLGNQIVYRNVWQYPSFFDRSCRREYELSFNLGQDLFEKYYLIRQRYIYFRDEDPQYKAYISYWKNKVEKSYQKDIITRINELDSQKYGVYKRRALAAYAVSRCSFFPLFEPNTQRYHRIKHEFISDFEKGKVFLTDYQIKHMLHLQEKGHLPLTSRPITANDTLTVTDFDILRISGDENGVLYDDYIVNSFRFRKKRR